MLYHLPGVAAVTAAERVFRIRHSFRSVPAVMVVTGGLYACLLWLALSRV